MAIDRVAEVFRLANCQGWVCALEVDGEGEACHDADEPVVTASVFKVAVALEVFCQVAAGSGPAGATHAVRANAWADGHLRVQR